MKRMIPPTNQVRACGDTSASISLPANRNARMNMIECPIDGSFVFLTDRIFYLGRTAAASQAPPSWVGRRSRAGAVMCRSLPCPISCPLLRQKRRAREKARFLESGCWSGKRVSRLHGVSSRRRNKFVPRHDAERSACVLFWMVASGSPRVCSWERQPSRRLLRRARVPSQCPATD